MPTSTSSSTTVGDRQPSPLGSPNLFPSMSSSSTSTSFTPRPPSTTTSSPNTTRTAAKGATYLILIQVLSRLLTFLINQLLLRRLSPALLGASLQLELYCVTVLYFSRDSLRVALQRQVDAPSPPSAAASEEKKGDEVASKRKRGVGKRGNAQAVVNVACVPALLAVPLAICLAALYGSSSGSWLTWRGKPAATSSSSSSSSSWLPEVAWMFASLWTYALASVIEAAAEPCFALAQLKLRYEIRAAAETAATIARGIAAMGSVMWCEANGVEVGVLPFAAGQMAYAVVLLGVYVAGAWGVAGEEGCALTLRWLGGQGRKKGEGCVVESAPASVSFACDVFSVRVANRYGLLRNQKIEFFFSLFSRDISSLAFNIYLQSGLKYLLTQGDALIITSMASLSDQGAYALASNYGSLVARMVFQPIEESSRSLFARLCSSEGVDASRGKEQPTSHKNDVNDERKATGKKAHKKQERSNDLPQAAQILTQILHSYLLLSLLAVSLGPPIAPKLLELLAGARWSSPSNDESKISTATASSSARLSSASSVLAAYTFYIPLLSLNGITESFISAVASAADLRAQSRAMAACSLTFAGAAWVFLGRGDMGARGLVWANCVGMVGRVGWSGAWIWRWFAARREGLDVFDILPHLGTPVVAAVGAYAVRNPPVALLRFEAWLAGGLALLGGNNALLASLARDAVVAVGLVVAIGVCEWKFLRGWWGILRGGK
ncbi:MAG: Oligosaccharide translocation protein rft1 [Alyxoria varia]|nr:MAG: Oligosaccharide translocation protein rft1 [Alyxoria varia]